MHYFEMTSRLDGYHLMIVSKYFNTINDFKNIEFVCKKFGNTMDKFHYNPIPVTQETLHYFTNIESLFVWS
ncbi:leucine rich repeat containing protein BspA family protein, partial [Entamoeba invadens IP1]